MNVKLFEIKKRQAPGKPASGFFAKFSSIQNKIGNVNEMYALNKCKSQTSSALERINSISVLLPERLAFSPCTFGPRTARGRLQNAIPLQSSPRKHPEWETVRNLRVLLLRQGMRYFNIVSVVLQSLILSPFSCKVHLAYSVMYCY